MEYDTKEKDYSLREFYELYKDKLPTIIRVTEGHCGENLAETFDYGQVIRIHKECRQERVIAVQYNDQGTEECTYSFPVNSSMHFHLEEIYKNEKKTLTLEEVLNRRQLPVDVELTRKHLNQSECSISVKDPFITLRLRKRFDELCLLGNFIFDGDIDLQIVRIPLHLYAIRLSEVTGLRDKSKTDWKAFQTRLDRKANQLNFDAVAENPEIAKYKPKISSKLTSNEMEDAGSVYENLQLQTYINVNELFGKTQSSQRKPENPDLVCVYETVDLGPTGDKTGKEQRKKSSPKQATEPKKDAFKYHLPKQAFLSELASRFRKDQIPITKVSVGPQPPKIKPKPKLKGNAQESNISGQNTVKELSGKEVDNYITPVQSRLLSCSQPELNTRNTSSSPCVSDCYENMKIGRAEVRPMSISKSGTSQGFSVTQHSQCTSADVETRSISSNFEQKDGGNDQATIQVKNFKVNELGKWMTDRLRLGKYVERFAEELVDGATLLDLDENVLIQEFRFSPIEAKRLIKFAKEGHVPQ
ncbi:hypothetical protein ACJMK2_003883 [Sinanodonta woodiana]|uniref:SAM domain-containing protein n=1 Tax=Sinanodonta woodiana TaxID=1069815 RepID=A0ABD3Y1A1_SINWO